MVGVAEVLFGESDLVLRAEGQHGAGARAVTRRANEAAREQTFEVEADAGIGQFVILCDTVVGQDFE